MALGTLFSALVKDDDNTRGIEVAFPINLRSVNIHSPKPVMGVLPPLQPAAIWHRQ